MKKMFLLKDNAFHVQVILVVMNTLKYNPMKNQTN